jgi:hypothetical protein
LRNSASFRSTVTLEQLKRAANWAIVKPSARAAARRFNFRSSQIWRPCCAVMPRSHAGDIQNRSGKAKDYLQADLAEAKARCQAIAAGIIGELVTGGYSALAHELFTVRPQAAGQAAIIVAAAIAVIFIRCSSALHTKRPPVLGVTE